MKRREFFKLVPLSGLAAVFGIKLRAEPVKIHSIPVEFNGTITQQKFISYEKDRAWYLKHVQKYTLSKAKPPWVD